MYTHPWINHEVNYLNIILTFYSDLIWALTSKQSSFLVKRPYVTLSSDPLNLTKKNSKNSSGLVNEKAISVSQVDGSIVIKSKIAKNSNKPAKNVNVIKFNSNKPARTAALAVANLTKGYRNDLRAVAVKRVSQYSRSNYAKKSYTSKSRK